MPDDFVRRCLIVSPHFPPSTLAGVHRARHLAKHLPSHGWKPTVICVDPRFHVERLDPDLADLVPSSVDVIPVGALTATLTRPFGVAGDIGLRGLGHIRAAILREMRQSRPDVVLITGSPYYPMLLSSWIWRRWKRPVVLDFQDPWVSSEGARQRFGTKAWLSHRLAVTLEPLAVRNAAYITSVSDKQNDEMADRYPWIERSRMVGIPIGGDPEDFAELRNRKVVEAEASSERPITFSFVGTAMPRSGPLIRALFKGLAGLMRQNLQLAERIQMRFVGTSNQPDDAKTYRVLPIAIEEGVGALVREEPARVPYLDALRILSATDVVLMIGSDEPHYTASKIYPGLMSNRPFLSLFHCQSSAHEVLSKAGGGIALAFEDNKGLERRVPDISAALATLATKPESLGSIDPASYERFTAHAVAGRFAEIFHKVVPQDQNLTSVAAQ
jgi:hypothetical protein